MKSTRDSILILVYMNTIQEIATILLLHDTQEPDHNPAFYTNLLPNGTTYLPLSKYLNQLPPLEENLRDTIVLSFEIIYILYFIYK